MIGWIFLAGSLLVIVAFLWARARLWRDFQDSVAPADDLRRADDGHRPPEDTTGGWL